MIKAFLILRTKLILGTIALCVFLAGCSEERGGVIVDSSGEQGGGTQPGGGGFAFVLLFVVVFCCVTAMFAMDRIQKRKLNSQDDNDEQEK